MCGIIAVVRRRTTRPVPAAADVLGKVVGVGALLEGVAAGDAAPALDSVSQRLEAADRLLRGAPGAHLMLAEPALEPSIRSELDDLTRRLDVLEAALDDRAIVAGLDVEAVNANLIRARDAAWAIERDRLRAGRQIRSLGGRDLHDAGIDAMLSVHQALSALDRLEVRGRDSAGLHLLVSGHGLDLTDPVISSELADRVGDELFTDSSVRVVGDRLSFVYKVAAEIGEQ